MSNAEKFSKKVIRELQRRSQMTYRLSRRGYRKYRNWYFKQGRKHFSWSDYKCEREFRLFIRAFNVTIE